MNEIFHEEFMPFIQVGTLWCGFFHNREQFILGSIEKNEVTVSKDNNNGGVSLLDNQQEIILPCISVLPFW